MTTVLQFLYATPTETYWVALAVLAVLAWLRGGPWERLAAGAQVLAFAIGVLVQDKQHLSGPQYGYLAVDISLFLVLTAIALRSRLWWATWGAGFTLFGIAIHVAKIADENVEGYAYYMGIALYTYLVIGTSMVGAWTHKRE